MSFSVKLLLLLSALLSALTGAATGARVPQLAVAVAASTQAAAVSATRTRVTERPAADLPGVGVVRAIVGARWALTPVAPLFLSRRRE